MYYYTNSYDLWPLSHNVTFDGVMKRITINPNVNTVDVKADLYSDWKEWAQLRDNIKFPIAMRATGGELTDPVRGLYSGDIYFLMNGWQIVIPHMVNLTGVLYHDDGISPYIVQKGGGITATVANLVQTVSTAATPTAPTVQQIRQEMDDHSTKLLNILQAIVSIPTPLNAVNIADAVWNSQTADHLQPGTVGMMLAQIKADTATTTISTSALHSLVGTLLKYEKNRTRIDKNTKQMFVYDDDGVTVLHTFNLKDSTGTASIIEVAERVPVIPPP